MREEKRRNIDIAAQRLELERGQAAIEERGGERAGSEDMKLDLDLDRLILEGSLRSLAKAHRLMPARLRYLPAYLEAQRRCSA